MNKAQHTRAFFELAKPTLFISDHQSSEIGTGPIETLKLTVPQPFTYMLFEHAVIQVCSLTVNIMRFFCTVQVIIKTC